MSLTSRIPEVCLDDEAEHLRWDRFYLRLARAEISKGNKQTARNLLLSVSKSESCSLRSQARAMLVEVQA